MSDALIVAIITGLASVLSVIITNKQSNKEVEHKLETAQAITDTKLDHLTEEIKKHNHFAERIPVIEEQQKEQWERIHILENKVN